MMMKTNEQQSGIPADHGTDVGQASVPAAGNNEQETQGLPDGDPGSVADEGAMVGDMDGGGGVGMGTSPDPHMEDDDQGPMPDKAGL